MPKGSRVYLEDILDAIGKIERYTQGFSFDDFARNELVTDAVIRNLEVIGEAVKNLPAATKERHPEVEWRKIAGLRNLLIHEYFGINLEIVWDVIEHKLPQLRTDLERVRAAEDAHSV